MLKYENSIDGELQFTMQEVIKYNGVSQPEPDAETGNVTFLNCTRGVDGTTAQDVAADESAIIVPGRASLTLSAISWQIPSDENPFQVVVSNSSDLQAWCHVYSQGSRQQVRPPIETSAAVAYSWVVIGSIRFPAGLDTLDCLL
jgi:hypothetical protein